ncbi:retinoic acid early transcript 1E-like isoform X2 [Diceros bicornis minor]|uniref:retinoic acid early transcript 1E-like isoform X2 n=1 Tax=Diceros bicornis minor TaxID=77932 RepID=UPI0026EACAF2|nr:retinoic acid early transcript 1E-like isoform X2 [Diceros bicornis minor]XP_058390145.1 retinoic acid early transcript 1E-like isoform X2 [Diceros bicornis minor]XP_058390146.1 retinoic acid early transcript 1E-like isoform X2 [Diceros bicornis minor]
MLLSSRRAGLLWEILLLVQAGKTLGDAHSLCLEFTVKSQCRPGQPWGEVQGSVDEKPFLQYDSNSNKVRPLGVLGEKVNATKAWMDLTQTLGEVGRDLRMILPVIKLEKKGTRGLRTMQVKLSCQREAERRTGASWEFSIEGQTALFDTMTMNWTVVDPGARGIKEEWENHQELAKHFRKISAGDCNHWLREFLEHWEKLLEPTEPPLKAPDTHQSSSMWIIIASVLIGSVLICLVLIGVIIVKCRRRSYDPSSEVSSLDCEKVMLDQPLVAKPDS